MPVISTFFGILIRMYWRDHNPPHIHAFYQGYEALVRIENGEMLAGHLPSGAERLVRRWVLDRQDALMRNWELGRERRPFETIPGADVE